MQRTRSALSRQRNIRGKESPTSKIARTQANPAATKRRMDVRTLTVRIRASPRLR
jgi:hypothetical protein